MAVQVKPECLPYLNRVGIKQHLLDCLNERRRSVKKDMIMRGYVLVGPMNLLAVPRSEC